MTTSSTDVYARLRDHNGDPDPQAVVAALWPYDGPHTSETVVSAARTVDELLGYLCNATLGPAGFHDTTVMYGVLGALREATPRLARLMGQASGGAERMAARPDLYDDRDGEEPSQVAGSLAEDLDGIRGEFAEAAGRIIDAHNEAAHLGRNATE